ncbi:MAG: hypothetical protein J6V69_04995 [Clostridia bacterium]|nr:hypothetical protein [Clostridia bacterium]
MKSKITCRTIDKGIQEFYLIHCGETYTLFQQEYRKSNKEFFSKGIYLSDLNKYSKVHSSCVKHMLDKLPLAIACVEKEYGIVVYEKKKGIGKEPYKRTRFEWQDMEVA